MCHSVTLSLTLSTIETLRTCMLLVDCVLTSPVFFAPERETDKINIAQYVFSPQREYTSRSIVRCTQTVVVYHDSKVPTVIIIFTVTL